MWIQMAGRATAILEAKRYNFVRPPRCTHLVTIVARHGSVRSCQGKARVAMLRDGEQGTVKITHGMAILAFVQVRSRRKLAIMCILVAVGTKRELHLVDRVFASRQMAFAAFDRDVLAF